MRGVRCDRRANDDMCSVLIVIYRRRVLRRTAVIDFRVEICVAAKGVGEVVLHLVT
jgi:hypothetical protein